MLVDPQAALGLQGFGPQYKTQQEKALQESSDPENIYLPSTKKSQINSSLFVVDAFLPEPTVEQITWTDC